MSCTRLPYFLGARVCSVPSRMFPTPISHALNGADRFQQGMWHYSGTDCQWLPGRQDLQLAQGRKEQGGSGFLVPDLSPNSTPQHLKMS